MIVGVFSIAGSVWLVVDPVFVWNRTDSVPKGLYIVYEAPLERGQLVAYKPTQAEDDWLAQQGITPGSWPLLKRVVALEGDEVCWDENEVFVNGELRANRIDGVKLCLLDGCVLLGADQVFLLNKHPRSVDGRYFGIQDADRIIGTARVVWVSNNTAKTAKRGEESEAGVSGSRRARFKARLTMPPTPLSAHRFFCAGSANAVTFASFAATAPHKLSCDQTP